MIAFYTEIMTRRMYCKTCIEALKYCLLVQIKTLNVKMDLFITSMSFVSSVTLFFLALVSFVIFVFLECSHYFMALDMKMMLEIKQIGIFCFF